MERREFLTVCSGACLGIVGLSGVVQSCASSRIFPSTVQNNIIQVSQSEFYIKKKKRATHRKYILIQPEGQDYPIMLRRYDPLWYSALLLRCTHQGNELSVSGDIFTCAAHGSEFDKSGGVIQGPAEEKLTSYKVTTDDNNVYIHLS